MVWLLIALLSCQARSASFFGRPRARERHGACLCAPAARCGALGLGAVSDRGQGGQANTPLLACLHWLQWLARRCTGSQDGCSEGSADAPEPCHGGGRRVCTSPRPSGACSHALARAWRTTSQGARLPRYSLGEAPSLPLGVVPTLSRIPLVGRSDAPPWPGLRRSNGRC